MSDIGSTGSIGAVPVETDGSLMIPFHSIPMLPLSYWTGLSQGESTTRRVHRRLRRSVSGALIEIGLHDPRRRVFAGALHGLRMGRIENSKACSSSRRPIDRDSH